MSLYNLINGVNPLAGALLAALDLTPGKVGRFRDCFLARKGGAEDGELQIHVYTRNGGGNREHYGDDPPEGESCECCACFMRYRAHKLEGYICDRDDDYDCTYATLEFKVPEKLRPMLEALVEKHPESIPDSPGDRFNAFLEKLKSEPGDPAVQRVTEAMKPIFEKLAEASKA